MFLPNIILFNFHKSSASGGGAMDKKEDLVFVKEESKAQREVTGPDPTAREGFKP